jgi:Peptidase M50B-like
MQATHAVLPGTEAPLPGFEAAFIGLAAFAVVLIPFLWPLVDHFDTMAHEGAHAVVGSAMGFTVLGVTMDRKSNGATYLAAGSGLRWLLAAFAGYLGPSGFGLGAAKLIETGHAVCVLWVAAILLVMLLFLVRKSFGVISVPAAIALLAVVMRYAHNGLEEVIVYGMTWLLLLSGVRNAVAHGARAGDAGRLSAMTHLPRRLWAVLWIAGTLLAVATGGKWLVLRS